MQQVELHAALNLDWKHLVCTQVLPDSTVGQNMAYYALFWINMDEVVGVFTMRFSRK